MSTIYLSATATAFTFFPNFIIGKETRFLSRRTIIHFRSILVAIYKVILRALNTYTLFNGTQTIINWQNGFMPVIYFAYKCEFKPKKELIEHAWLVTCSENNFLNWSVISLIIDCL